MRILVSTFGPGDGEKIILAMTKLPYDRLVLVGAEGTEDTDAFLRLKALEEMAGHDVEAVSLGELEFMELTDAVASVLQDLMRPRAPGRPNSVVLNISGGSKLLGDAALLAAFRLGVETYHCEGRVTKLPVLRGATARDRFTQAQIRFMLALGDRQMTLAKLAEKLKPTSRLAVERVLRELRKEGLVMAELSSGEVRAQLSESGIEVLRSLRMTP